MSLITIKTFDNAIEAHIMKSKFVHENINCYLCDEHLMTINPLYNIAIGGIKLQVEPQDYGKAIAILDHYANAPLLLDNGLPIICPQCGSTDYFKGFKSFKNMIGFLSAILSLTLIIFPFYYKTVNKCKLCHHEFTSE